MSLNHSLYIPTLNAISKQAGVKQKVNYIDLYFATQKLKLLIVQFQMDNTLSIMLMNQCRQVLLQLFHGHKMFRDFCFCYGILHFHMLKQKVIYWL